MLQRFATTTTLLCTLLALPFFATAQSIGYVGDEIFVPLWKSPDRRGIAHRGLKSGRQVTILEKHTSEPFTLVRTPAGTEGWIENQYLRSSPIAAMQLKSERERRRELEQKLASLSSENKSVSSANSEARRELQSLSKQNESLSSELASIKKISSNAINLDISNRELLQKNEMLKVQIAELQAENARLSDKSNKDWFIRGALAVAIGALLAVILPRFKPKSRNSEWA